MNQRWTKTRDEDRPNQPEVEPNGSFQGEVALTVLEVFRESDNLPVDS